MLDAINIITFFPPLFIGGLKDVNRMQLLLLSIVGSIGRLLLSCIEAIIIMMNKGQPECNVIILFALGANYLKM
jgi:hypothetical protein